MQNNDQKDQLTTLLYKHWKLRCDVVGKQSVEDLATAIQEGHSPDDIFKRIEGGRDFDITFTLKVLVEAATLVKVSIEIYKALHSTLGRKPTSSELENEVKAAGVLDRVTQAAVKDKLPTVVEDLVSS
jgi:hypothetical protein